MQVTVFLARMYHRIQNLLDFITPFFDLLARLWVGIIFFKSGLLKIQNWQGTLFLFENEFHVPLIPVHWSALLGTGAEILLPILLILGLGGRIMIFIFFLYNVTSVLFYPFLWTPEGGQGLADHICWGVILGLLMCHGPGKLSLDYLIQKRYGQK